VPKRNRVGKKKKKYSVVEKERSRLCFPERKLRETTTTALAEKRARECAFTPPASAVPLGFQKRENAFRRYGGVG